MRVNIFRSALDETPSETLEFPTTEAFSAWLAGQDRVSFELPDGVPA